MEDEVYETPSASPISLCCAKTSRFLFHYLRSGSRLISMTNSRPRVWRIYLIKLMLFAKKERREGRREEKKEGRWEGREGRGARPTCSPTLSLYFQNFSWAGRE